MASLSELIAQREKLEIEIEHTTAATRSEGIAKIRALMERSGLTIADIQGPKSESNDAGKRAGRGASTMQKYR